MNEKIINNINNCNDIFNIFNILQEVSIPKTMQRGTENEIVNVINNKYGSLDNLITKLETENPYQNGRNIRNDYNIEEREDYNEHLSRLFREYSKEKKGIGLEDGIIRNIYYRSKKYGEYDNIIGKVIGYSMQLEDSKNSSSIDLISYDENSNTINLIEVKSCPTKFDDKDIYHNLISTMIKCSTNYSYINFAWKINNNLKNYLREVLIKNNFNMTDEKIDKINFQKVIIGPKNLYHSLNSDIEKLLQNYKLYTITVNETVNDLNPHRVDGKLIDNNENIVPNSKDYKLFDIDKYNI